MLCRMQDTKLLESLLDSVKVQQPGWHIKNKRKHKKNKQTTQNQHTHFFLVLQKMEIKVAFTLIHHSSRIYLPKDQGSAKAHMPRLEQRFQPPKGENCAVRSITTSGPFSRNCHQYYQFFFSSRIVKVTKRNFV